VPTREAQRHRIGLFLRWWNEQIEIAKPRDNDPCEGNFRCGSAGVESIAPVEDFFTILSGDVDAQPHGGLRTLKAL